MSTVFSALRPILNHPVSYGSLVTPLRPAQLPEAGGLSGAGQAAHSGCATHEPVPGPQRGVPGRP